MTSASVRVSTFSKVTATKIALEVHICSTAGLVLFPFDKKFVDEYNHKKIAKGQQIDMFIYLVPESEGCHKGSHQLF